ncbi:MAG: sugar phosphate nucleotidyltransferase [Deltaproteobacteria bacterium]|nr:sugar phosphate nucleotidyltransferase [Deltaproteobacteria bacterium]
MKTCAYVLSAGLGSRLRPITCEIPKPLVPIQGKPCIDWILNRLSKLSLDQIFVNVHHLKERLIEHIKDHWSYVEIIEEPYLSGTGGAIRANSHLKNFDLILVHNADIITNTNLATLIKFHKAHHTEVTLLCKEIPSTRYLSFDENEFCGWGNSATRNYYGYISKTKKKFLGIHILSGKLTPLFDQVKEKEFSIFDVYLNSNITAISMTDNECFWKDIGRLEDLNYINSLTNLKQLIE